MAGSAISRARAAALALLAASLASACGGGPNRVAARAPRVAYAELSGANRKAAAQHLMRVPFVLTFRKGDRVPLSLSLESSLVELDIPELTLVAKRDFSLLFNDDGPPLLSEDGVDFEARHQNSFFFGLSVERERPARMQVGIRLRPEAPPAPPAP